MSNDKKLTTSTHQSPASPQVFLKRREFFRSVVMGSMGYGAYSFLKQRSVHAMGAVLREGLAQPGYALRHAQDVIREALAGGPALLQIGQAMAATNTNPAVFHVFYQTSHDIRHELYLGGQGAQYNMYGTGSVSPMMPGSGSAPAGLVTAMNTAAPAPFSMLNMWSYQLLTTGMINGSIAFPGVSAAPALTAEQIAQISIISTVGLPGSQGIHQTASIPTVGNLEYVMQSSYANYSPVGAVVLDTNAYNGMGAVAQSGRSVNDFLGSVTVPGTYMSRSQAGTNPLQSLDAIAGDAGAPAIRAQMLQAYALLTQSLSSIQTYGGVATNSFSTYGSRPMEGLAAMLMFAGLFQNGLATIGSVAMNSYDFHATDALRVPTGGNGNMLTETAQALAGVFGIAQAAFAAKLDAVVYTSTCSNRNQNWTGDDPHVSTMTYIIKGSGSASPFAAVPSQQILLCDGASGMYAEAPSVTPNYSGATATSLGMTGNSTVGRYEAGLITAVGKAIGQTPTATLEMSAAKII